MTIQEFRNGCIIRLNNVEEILNNKDKFTENDYNNAIIDFKTYVQTIYNMIYNESTDNQMLFSDYVVSNSLLRMASTAFGYGYIIDNRILNFTEYSYPVNDIDESMSINMLIIWRDYLNKLYRSVITKYNSRYYLSGLINNVYNLFGSLEHMITNNEINRNDIYIWSLNEISTNMRILFTENVDNSNANIIFNILTNNDILNFTNNYASTGKFDKDIIPELTQYTDNEILKFIQVFIYCQINGIFEVIFAFIDNYMFYELSLACNYLRYIQSILEGL